MSAIRNASYTSIGNLVNSIIQLVSIPILMNELEATAFATFLFSTAVVDQLTVLDGGIAPVLVRKYAVQLHKQASSVLRREVSSHLGLSCVLAFFACLAVVGIALPWSAIQPNASPAAQVSRLGWGLIASMAIMSITSSPLVALMHASEDFKLLAVCNTTSQILRNSAYLLAALAGGGPNNLLQIASIIQFAYLLIIYSYLTKNVIHGALTVTLPSWRESKQTLLEGASLVIGNFAARSVFGLARIGLGGSGEVLKMVAYETALRLCMQSRVLLYNLNTTLPQLSRLWSNGQRADAQVLVIKGTIILTTIYGVLAVVVPKLIEPVLQMWFPAGIPFVGEIRLHCQYLFFASAIQAASVMYYPLAQAAGQTRSFTFAMLCYPIVYIPLAIVLYRQMGSIGLSLAAPWAVFAGELALMHGLWRKRIVNPMLCLKLMACTGTLVGFLQYELPTVGMFSIPVMSPDNFLLPAGVTGVSSLTFLLYFLIAWYALVGQSRMTKGEFN